MCIHWVETGTTFGHTVYTPSSCELAECSGGAEALQMQEVWKHCDNEGVC